MFQRVEYSEWLSIFPKIGFVLFFVAFGFIVWRALRMEPRERERRGRMPLDD